MILNLNDSDSRNINLKKKINSNNIRLLIKYSSQAEMVPVWTKLFSLMACELKIKFSFLFWEELIHFSCVRKRCKKNLASVEIIYIQAARNQLHLYMWINGYLCHCYIYCRAGSRLKLSQTAYEQKKLYEMFKIYQKSNYRLIDLRNVLCRLSEKGFLTVWCGFNRIWALLTMRKLTYLQKK